MNYSAADLHEIVREEILRSFPEASLLGDDIVAEHGRYRATIRLAALTDKLIDLPPESVRSEVKESIARTRSHFLAMISSAIELLPASETRLRIMPAWNDAAAGAVASVRIAKSIDAVISVQDKSGRWIYPPRTALDEYGGADRAISVAAVNTIKFELSDVDIRDYFVGSLECKMIAKDGSGFVPTTLLAIPAIVGDVGNYGVLVSMPRYSAVLMARVCSTEDIFGASELKRITSTFYNSADDAASDRVYWWQNGEYHNLDFDNGGILLMTSEVESLCKVFDSNEP